MIGPERIRALGREVAARPGPVVSLYLDVNPARLENARKAYALRARAAMDELGVPKRASRRLAERVRQDLGIPDARTLVVFAGTDLGGHFESYALKSELPLVAAAGGALARWGEPYVAPLLLALQQSQRYLALLLASDRVRLFELYLEEVVEKDAFVQPLDASDWRPLREHATGMPGVPARGGSGKDLFDKRVADWRRRFHQDVARRLDGVLGTLGGEARLILMGQPPEIAAFEPLLPAALQALVVERLAAPGNPAAPATELEPLLTAAATRIERAAGSDLLDRIREAGVWGTGPTLEAVEDGRVHVLAVPWHMDAAVFRCRQSGRVTATRDAAERLCPGDAPEQVALADVLPTLAARHGMKLVVLLDDNEARLLRDFDGLAGLTRW